MMKLILVFMLFFSVTCCWAQSVEKDVISASGESIANSEYTLNFTIGEPIVGLVNDESSLDQGFWASTLLVVPITSEKNFVGITIYPNPVATELNIFTNNTPVNAITLFGVDGKRALKKKVDATLIEHKINLSHLSKGMYVLQLFVEGTDEEKLFKIIKK